MAELFYKDERDSEFFKICESVRVEKGVYAPIAEIVSQAILMPTSSFFLHPKEYSNIIRGKNLPKNAIKRELHLEIIRRHRDIKEKSPDLKTHEIAKILDTQPAPRFYISTRRAVDLYYSLLKNRPRI